MISNITASKHINLYSNGGGGNFMYKPEGYMLRYNSGNIEACSSAGWYPVGNSVQIDFSQDASNALDWAINKMRQEEKINGLLDKHPELRQAKEVYEILLNLVNQGD